MKSITNLFLLLILVTLTLGMTGCGSGYGPMGSIKGKLTMAGEPLPEGTKLIFMHPHDGHAGFGLTDEGGNYTIEWRRDGTTYDGLPVGQYEVMLVAAGTGDVDDLSADEMLDGGPGKLPKNTIPARYRRASTSGLVYEIADGENSIDIDILKK